MKTLLAVAMLLTIAAQMFAGTETASVSPMPGELNPDRFELALESGYLFGVINPPRPYQIGAEFITGRVRWGVRDSDDWLRGYHQFYVSAMAEPIFRGIETHYFGLNFGLRYNFVPVGSRFTPYVSGGLGLGWIDSHSNISGGQGQDFTFNILSAVGVTYRLNSNWDLNAGVLYQHLSNGGQTDPNPSLNLLGPQVGVTYSF
jgi:lipid A 3-O-deacylase